MKPRAVREILVRLWKHLINGKKKFKKLQNNPYLESIRLNKLTNRFRRKNDLIISKAVILSKKVVKVLTGSPSFESWNRKLSKVNRTSLFGPLGNMETVQSVRHPSSISGQIWPAFTAVIFDRSSAEGLVWEMTFWENGKNPKFYFSNPKQK